MMMLVAAAAALIWSVQINCRRQARLHGTEAVKLKAELRSALQFKGETGYFPGCGWAQACLETENERAEWHAHLKVKYQAAVFRPWLLLQPDPPEPE
jgi:hypothetical protein